ncbi:ATP-binding protein [Streptomyces sp. Rer75]|uniref:ATP-binding protein n=1 Tax=unclassified Streptomyces TaxID=2593676 RepID=UPI0015D07422|nr:ATP-binding protein [Streptomyces sp. Rer75]QLH25076.1 ATP-binding protein [Streptomyces sp. Rer75]
MEIVGRVPSEPGHAPPRGPAVGEGVWRFTAPALESSVPQARHAVRDLLAHQGVSGQGDLVPNLLLIVSELVTNAVRHAALLSPQIAVEVSIGRGWVRVAVEDNHPYRPRPLELEADQGRTGGRGLLLVQAIAEESGGRYDVDHTASGGKAVWAALPLTSAAPGPVPGGGPLTSLRPPRSAPGSPAGPRPARS